MERLEILHCDNNVKLLPEMSLCKYLNCKKLNIYSLMINVKYILKMNINNFMKYIRYKLIKLFK